MAGMKHTIKFGTATATFDHPDTPKGGLVGSVKARGAMPRDGMNGLERRYSVHLEFRRLQGEVMWWKFHALKLRLANDTFYETDFFLMLPDGLMEVHETKGWWRDDARVKIKVAASMYPFKFVGVTERSKAEGRGWEYEMF